MKKRFLKVNMKAEYINSFIRSTWDIMTSMFNINLESGKYFLYEQESSHRWEISGGIVIQGSINGFAALRLSKLLAKKLLEKSGLSFFDENEKDMLSVDMMKELINIIASNFLTNLEEADAIVSPPFIMQGKDHVLSLPSMPVIAIPYITEFGPFLVLTAIVEAPSSL